MIAAALLLALSISACGAKPAATTTEPPAPGASAPAATEVPAAPAGETAQPAATFPEGDTDLEHPGQGLDALPSYRQTLEMTLRGTLDSSPYEETQRIERLVAGENGWLRVSSSATGSQPVEMFDAFLDGYHYSQDRAGVSCRAEAVDENTAPHPELAQRLPSAFGIREAGREQRGEAAAVHYTFDAQSLPPRDGTLQQASGEVWIAEAGGAVLAYNLTAEIAAGEFVGTRTWSYALEEGAPVQLPAACQPVLAGLPTLPGAADVLNLSGFQRYAAPASRSEAVAFYYSQLTALGWQALPGSAPEQADLESEATVVSYAQPYADGGRVLVIQLSDDGGQLQVVLQSVLTRAPVQPGVTSAPIDAETEPEDEEPTDASQPLLPEDLPEYPGATVVTRLEYFVILNIDAPAADVADFYTRELTAAGWQQEQNMDNAGMTMLLWSREGKSLSVTIMEQGSTLQVAITATD